MKSSTPQNTGAEALFLRGIFRAVFDFFASLQLAVGTLVALMIILAAGTLIESRYSSDAARILIYGTGWFSFVLIVLAANLACSAASRMPWKKKHIGFVLTHLGIITILAGSLMTQKYAIDGQMAVEEGSSAKWVTLKQPVLFVYSQALQDVRTVALPERALRWKGHHLAAELKNKDQSAKISITQFYPKARSESKWKAAEGGTAALKVNLRNAFVDVSEWLADAPGSDNISMGPAVLKIAHEFSEENPAAESEAHLEVRRGEERFSLAVPEAAELPFEKELTPGLTVKILELYKYAFVDNNNLKEGRSGENAPNPAAVLEFKAADGNTEKHTVFAQFPDFPTVHGMKSTLGLSVAYHGPEEHAPVNELRFIPRADGLWYEIAGKSGIKKGKAEPGQEIATGWMDLKFTVNEWLPKAVPELAVTPLADDDKSENAAAAMELEVRAGSETRLFWLTEGAQKTVGLEGGLFEFVFGRKQLPLGFEVKLKDFRVKHNPGTENAAAFESDVVLQDHTRGTTLEKTISMNQPLLYKGFRFYQASFSAAKSGPETSVFAVGSDPGIPVKYAGALIMVGGILLMFYTRAYSTRNERGLQ